MNNFNTNKATTSTSPCKNCPNRLVTENGKVCEKDCAKWFSYKLEIEMVKQEKENEKNCKNYFKF